MRLRAKQSEPQAKPIHDDAYKDPCFDFKYIRVRPFILVFLVEKTNVRPKCLGIRVENDTGAIRFVGRRVFVLLRSIVEQLNYHAACPDKRSVLSGRSLWLVRTIVERHTRGVKQREKVHRYSMRSNVIKQGLLTASGCIHPAVVSTYRDMVIVQKLGTVIECPVFRMKMDRK